jgi:membrane protein YdbS with pleckstrin-like domain
MRTPLQKGEKIILVTYSSWIVLIGPVLLALAGLIISYFIGFFDHWGWIAAVLGIGYFIIRYFQWKVNIWVVTNYRVIDEEGLLNHFAKESPLDKINNVSYDQSVWGRIFNFGHVEIQTAAQIGATDYFNVNHPKRLKDNITLSQSEYKNIQTGNQAMQMATALGLNHLTTPAGRTSSQFVAEELERLYELKRKGILTEDEYNKMKSKLLDN